MARRRPTLPPRAPRAATTPPPAIVELAIDSLAAGGDGCGRDADGRVTFVPRSAPGDRVRVRIARATTSFARGELVELLVAGPARATPACPHVADGCGGCAWMHVTRAAQLAAKQDVVARALRRLGAELHPIADAAPALRWRRRARFHVAGGAVGLYAESSRALVPIRACLQLEPGLDAALAAVAAAGPPDGELALAIGHDGAVVIGTEARWTTGDPAALIGRAGIVGVLAGDRVIGERVVALEPDLVSGPWDFAQASTAGNATLRAVAAAALGPPPSPGATLLELHAGAGNLTRAYAAAGWRVIPSDVVAPARPPADFLVGRGAAILRRGIACDAIALDPPRTGAADEVAGILAARPRTIVYVSCDPATLARDAEALTATGAYRATDAWPIDLMPQTAHVECVLRLRAI